MTHKFSSPGFTLIELIASIAIVLALSGLILPTVAKMRSRAEAAACLGNLRQIGTAALLYAGDHEQTFPTIEPWPSDPIYNSDSGAQSLLEALNDYGVEERTVCCQADRKGPNYHAREHSSYEWCPMANNQKMQSVKLNWGPGRDFSLSELLIAFDYSNVHDGASNLLFGDGHVVPANSEK